MVSTRGVKLKFFEGERVLCYEPDPTKAKVLYDSKVLDIFVKKDSRGKKFVEYMIHFQGWNSSWDRSVSEEYVLKDTPENRQLQRDLAEKSQLHIGAYLYRKERKKHSRGSGKVNERAAQSSEDGSCGSPALMEEEDGNGPSSSSEDESSADEDIVPVELPPFLKERLENDFYNVKTKSKLHKLPCDINVVHILEDYWKHYVTKLLNSANEKPSRRHHPYNNHTKRRPEDIQRKLSLCKEVLDGIRIYFDFTLKDMLLYNPEQGQIATAPTRAAQSLTIKLDTSLKTEVEDQEYAHLPIVDDDDSFQSDMDTTSGTPSGRLTRRRTLRSNKSCDSNSNGTVHPESSSKVKNSTSQNNHVDVNGLGVKSPAWKAVPDSAYAQNPPPPCLVYGATHLARLFGFNLFNLVTSPVTHDRYGKEAISRQRRHLFDKVKMPELLSMSTLSDDKLKIVVERFEHFLTYLSEHKEWFEDSNYIDA